MNTETWEQLFAEAEQFRRLAPWKWMFDSHIVGLHHPQTNDVFLTSFLGRLGQVLGLLVYRNDSGRRWLLETILSEDGAPKECSAFEQDAIKMEFVNKRELVSEDQAVLKMIHFTPSSKSGRIWPQFRSFIPGAYPWHLTQKEAATLLCVLPRVAAMAALVKQQPHLWDSHCDGEVAFLPPDFNPATTELEPQQIDWRPMIPPPAPSVKAFARMDAKTITDLATLPKAAHFELEVDLDFSSVIVIGNTDRPRFPKLAMAVDRDSGFVGGFHLAESHDPEGATALGEVVRSTLSQFGVRPRVILVQHRRVAEMLKKLAAELDVEVVMDPDLEALNFAKASMEEHFRKR